jgi:hypothetical protein
MPGKNNASAAKGKGFNRKNQYADKANKKVLGDMISEGFDEKSMRIAKINKNVGNSRVLGLLSDGRDNVNMLIRPVLRGKQATPIGLGSIVLISLPDWEKDEAVARANGGALVKDPVAYIEAVLDKKTIRALDKEGKIPPGFLKEGGGLSDGSDEDGFVFDDGEEEDLLMPSDEDDDDEGTPTNSASAAAAPPKKKWTGHATSAPRIGDDFDVDAI